MDLGVCTLERRVRKSGGGDNEPVFSAKVEDIRLTPINAHGAVFYEAIIEVKNEQDPDTHEWRLRPGMTASVDIIRREHEKVWKVPTAALSSSKSSWQRTGMSNSLTTMLPLAPSFRSKSTTGGE